MKIQDKPIEKGMMVFYPSETSTTGKYNPGQVIDFNEHVGAVKLMTYIGSKEKRHGKGKWIAASLLKLTDPGIKNKA